MDFLSEENVCGQSLLKLVSRGSAILAELQRLSDNIPKIFYGQSPEYKKYEKILFTFDYLMNIDSFEDEIQRNQEILELDENFKKTYMQLIERFYILFESIYLYYSDLMAFLQELYDAVFIQYTVELVLQNQEGKRLMCEAFYLYGCMLLLLDNLIIGQVREKLVIAYYRFKGGQSAITYINQVCKLCKDTGYLPQKYTDGLTPRRPQFYPEEYFGRFELPADLIIELVNAVKDDDIYKYMNAFPLAEQRSFALSTQAGMLYVLLFFNPKILNSQNSKMREIVDKHFNDNWVIAYYLGYYVDLSYQWEPYKSARLAILNTVEISYIKELITYFDTKMQDATKRCEDYLLEGQITDEFVLDKVDKLMNCVRDCNITVRWFMLHRQTSIKLASDMFNQKVSPERILHLLLISSKFENKLKETFMYLIETKQSRWDDDKLKCVERMSELSDYFSGKALGKVVPDEGYRTWFVEMGSQINSLEFGDSTYAGRKIQQLSKALEDIEQYQQIASSIQVKHYLQETRNDLKHMVRIVSIKSILLTHIAFISDISYSWQCLQQFIGLMQEKVVKNPNSALLLKTTFQKLESILNTPLIRIIQANSPDMNSVSKYYSGELVKFVKEVLQIIPIQIFEILHYVIVLLNTKYKPLPSKLNKDILKDYAQFEERAQMAQLTNSIAVFTESILNVEAYTLGVIEVNPKELLDSGLRKQLLVLIHKILDKALFFPAKANSIEDFQAKLYKLADDLGAFRQSVEYIQDFINAYGNKMFIEEFDRLMGCYVDMEVACIITKKLTFEELSYDEDIPMPDEKSLPFEVINFTGRLFRQVLLLTDYRTATYIEASLGFYDAKTGADAFNMKSINLISKCIGNSGINGLDKLLGQTITMELQKIQRTILREMNEENRKLAQQQLNQIKILTSFNDNYEKFYQQLKKQFKSVISSILPSLQKVGQMVLLRRLISLHLQMKAKVGSSKLFLCLETFNDALLNDIKNREYNQNMEMDQNLQLENELLHNSLKLFSFVGLHDPLRKIYLTAQTPDYLSLVLTLTLMNQLPLLDFDNKLNTLVRKGKQEIPFEPNYLVVGIVTVLNQYHQTHTDIMVSYLGHYIKSVINFLVLQKDIQKNPDMIGDMFAMLYVVEEVFRFKDESYENFKQLIPFGLLSNLSKQNLKTASQT